ncbi:MAG: CHASE3 domain-containing protein [Verrucomicrobia bacterium]|nr:CHASE3 domain-containing protein [Verrucomicrobiota bacterium]
MSFAAIVLLLVLSLCAIYWMGNQALRKEKEVSTRRSATDELNVVLSTLKDAETGQRGYLLTGNEAYLAPFDQAQKRIGEALAKLTMSLDSQERTSSDFSQLIDLIPQKLAELRETVDLARQGKHDEGLAIVQSDRGKDLMDQIRMGASRVEDHEKNAIAIGQRAFDESIFQRNLVFGLVILFNLAFVFWAYRRIRQEGQSRTAALSETERQKELLRVTLLSIGDAVIVTNADGEIITMNKIAGELTGWTLSEAIGKPCETVFRIMNELTRQPVESPVTKVIRQGVIAGLANHTLLITRDGREIPIDDSGAPIREQDGSLHGVVLIFRDFSLHKATQDQLQKAADELMSANKAKDYFLATLSHELRTPLGAILGWSGLMKQSPDDRNILSQGLDVLERNANALSKLISELLDVSRIAAGALSLELQPLDLNQIVSSSIQAFAVEAGNKKIRLISILQDQDGSLNVRGDPVRLQEIVTNILGNSLKFTPEGGTVSVSLTRTERTAVVEIKDTGIGISPGFIDRVFEPFAQGEPGSHTDPGLGLGLAISKRLVELHGGSISVKSDGPGLGSTFIVQLPLIALGEPNRDLLRSVQTLQENGVFAGRLRNLKILAVDDHDDTREFLSVILERNGAEVTVVSSGKEALEALKNLRRDILLCDLAMPQMDGYELLKQVRALEPEIGRLPAIACTAFALAEDITRARGAGFQAYIAKPINPDELVATILQVIRPSGKQAADV